MREYIAVFRQRWRWLVACAVLGLLVSGVIGWQTPAQYTSDVTFFVTGHLPASDPAAAYEGTLLAQAQVKSYVDLLTDGRVGAEASARLGGTVDPATITRSISASAPADTALLHYSVTASSPEEAQRIAAAVSSSFTDLVANIETPTEPSAVDPWFTAVRLVRPATFSPTPSSLPFGLVLVVGTLVGFLVGLVGALVRNAMDGKVRTPAALASAAGVPALGRVPERPEQGAGVLGADDPSSPAPEALRGVRARLGFLGSRSEHRFLVVAAAGAHGSTSVACDLAASVAAAGSRVLLVDGDLRSRRVTQTFALPDTSPGLADVLAGKADFAACVVTAADGRVDVLPAGRGSTSPSELIVSGEASTVLAALRQQYELVVVDAPPILDLSDAAVLASRSDGVVLVARCGHVTGEDVERSVDLLDATGARVLGVVLADPARGERWAHRSVARPSGAAAAHPGTTAPAPVPADGIPSDRMTAPSPDPANAAGADADDALEPTSDSGVGASADETPTAEYVTMNVSSAGEREPAGSTDDESWEAPQARAANGHVPASDG